MSTPKKVKAQVMHGYLCSLWYLPRTAEAYDAMLVQGSYALYQTEGKRMCRDEVVAAMLRSIGITRPKETKL